MNPKETVKGGYVLIRTMELCMAWSLYRENRIRLIDLRVWFACKEMAARRSCCRRSPRVRFSLGELHRLVGGVGGEHLRSSIRRLEAAKLMQWSETAIRFASSPDELDEAARAAPVRMAERIATARRLVPVPRRQLRFLASGCRRAVIAALLAHLIRCLFSRKGELSTRGFCKASWIADVFGVGIRNIKEARKHLEQIGVLIAVDCPQWRLNRLGKCVSMNLAWSRTAGERSGGVRRSAPPRALSTSRSAPLESNRELLPDYKNQKPGGAGRSGFCGRGEKTSGKPMLSNIVPADLRSIDRQLALFRQAVAKGHCLDGEGPRIQFLAAAEHARTIGSRNPCGLFATIVRRGLWHVSTQDDEDTALRNYKAVLNRTQCRAAAEKSHSELSLALGALISKFSMGDAKNAHT